MTYLKHKNPCNDCPFRKAAPAGWMGSNNPTVFAHHASTGELPCHSTVDYERDDWQEQQEDAPKCAGALAMMANASMMPLSRQAQADRDEVGKRDDVFTWPMEFIQHHQNASVRSWEMR